MRRAGVLLTALALLAVQAPWIACACADDASCAPLLVGLLAHGGDEDAHGCCNAQAHLAHGRDHGHARCGGAPGRHCHGGYAHEHGDDGTPGEPEPTEHVGFRLPLATIQAAAGLGAPAPAFLALALIHDTPQLAPSTAAVVARFADPPRPPTAPSVSTERLLL